MELTRNHYLIIGVVLLGLGIQFRYVNTMVLNEPTTRWLNENIGPPQQAANSGILASFGPMTKRTIQPPPWLGWALMSIGGVVTLHSLAMNKPAG
ncbi:MAG: hypothetical protein JNM18_13500 [Planctomycetaceae bacterium]|nr:hypothetical protein [Planctomycetaceae bacterium]